MKLILSDKDNRVIFWGWSVDGDRLKVDLGYFAPSLSRKTIKVSNGENTFEVVLDDKVLRQNFSSKGQNLSLGLILTSLS